MNNTNELVDQMIQDDQNKTLQVLHPTNHKSTEYKIEASSSDESSDYDV